jgi:hypothetical protein
VWPLVNPASEHLFLKIYSLLSFCMMPLRSLCCCDRSASVQGAVRGMTFTAESQAAINPFSFSCASSLSKSSCSAACSLALIASSASLRQRKTVCEACSPVIRIAWLVGPEAPVSLPGTPLALSQIQGRALGLASGTPRSWRGTTLYSSTGDGEAAMTCRHVRHKR